MQYREFLGEGFYVLQITENKRITAVGVNGRNITLNKFTQQKPFGMQRYTLRGFRN